MSNEGCIKCGHQETVTKDVSLAGTGLSKLFDIEHNTFTVISCKNCGYTEFYSKQTNAGMNIMDLFFS
ncbi:zinc ribbon domain-containing protein [Macrococcus brunensis]|uniref:zinc ribbon domain-containing protein n=1 Tax=Macrococcus brunensis TaxID=198483 RepID=UPI001EF0AD7D|nr:zinc ribbon domain-containing protein [Macrococcus brunensis]ULG72030.1 zinc ribbon domain-containing protein [Macrococcus brunensis]